MGNEDKIKEFFEKIWDAIAQWFLKNKKAFALVEEMDSYILHWIKVLKQNSGYLKAIELVKAEHGRKLGQWLIIESEATIKLYTANAFIKLNKALRKLIPMERELNAMQKILDDALSKLPISKYNSQELKRSASFTEEQIKKMFRVGKDFTEKGFFSTTHSEEALMQWLIDNPSHNVIFKVYGKNGRLIEKASMLPYEYEVLFKSNTTFVVEGMKPIPNPIDRTKKVLEIILKEK